MASGVLAIQRVPTAPPPRSARCAWVGNIPESYTEQHIINEIELSGGPLPSRVLVRPSTGDVHGWYGIAYFRKVEVCREFKAMELIWGCGGRALIRPALHP